jgi:adenine-specific DNA methylase
MNKPFNVGDKVFDIRKGNGVVLSKFNGLIKVQFDNDPLAYCYTLKGYYIYANDKFPSIYHGHDLIVTVKEPEYEWQVLFFYPKTNSWHISTQFYSSIDHFLRETDTFYYTNVELFDPSKRILAR